MAHSLKAPSANLLRHLRYQQLQWHRPIYIPQTRQFSSTLRRNAKTMKADPRQFGVDVKMPSQPSIKGRVKEEMRKMEGGGAMATDDMGLLPDTFIMPPWSNRPDFTLYWNSGRTREWLKDVRLLYWTWIKRRATDLFNQWYYKFYVHKHTKQRPRPKLRRRAIVPKATQLHNDFYKAFAAGEIAQIKALANDGLAHSMSARLSHRPDTERLRWTLVSHIRRPRLVSHRATALPMKVKGEKVGIRQAVVKIVSLQRLQRGEQRSSRFYSQGTKGGNEFWSLEQEDVEWEPEREKIVTEYVVLQTMLIEGEERPWKIWGFAEETKVENLKGPSANALAGTENVGERAVDSQATAAGV